jgi:anti-sigma B factor antagonist
MQIRVERHRSAVVVSANGELDAFLAPQLEEAFAETLDDPLLVVDLSRVSFIDSTALGLVTRAIRGLDDYQRTARIVLPRGSARRIFEITTLDRVLPLSGSREEALVELTAEPGQERDGDSA